MGCMEPKRIVFESATRKRFTARFSRHEVVTRRVSYRFLVRCRLQPIWNDESWMWTYESHTTQKPLFSLHLPVRCAILFWCHIVDMFDIYRWGTDQSIVFNHRKQGNLVVRNHCETGHKVISVPASPADFLEVEWFATCRYHSSEPNDCSEFVVGRISVSFHLHVLCQRNIWDYSAAIARYRLVSFSGRQINNLP